MRNRMGEWMKEYRRSLREFKAWQKEKEIGHAWYDLRGVDLSHADFSNLDLRCADFRGAKLSWPDFRGTDLRSARLPAGVQWGVYVDSDTRTYKELEERYSELLNELTQEREQAQQFSMALGRYLVSATKGETDG